MAGRLLIVGAGLVGSLAAVYFARGGWRVTVMERRPDPRAKGYAGGRSINLALSARGLWGLAGVGLDADVLANDAIPMPGRMIHPPGGGPEVFQPYSKDPRDAINSVSRGGLNLTLLHAAAKEPGVTLRFSKRCLDVDIDNCRAVFADDDNAGAAPETVEADLIFGGDGAFSAVRTAMQKTDRFEYSQSYLAHGYKELHIPPADQLGVSKVGDGAPFALRPNALHIWPRGGSMMIALPNRDGSFTCTLFWPFAGEHSFELLEHAYASRKRRDPHATPTEAEQRAVRDFFAREYPDAVPLMPALTRDFFANPTGSLVTVRCFPWVRFAKDGARAVVIGGDAAHAIVPFYGQGMNAGFEDVRVLAQCLSGGGALSEALDAYQNLRKPNADAIADMALANFIEMRDKVASPEFRYRKRIEQALHSAFPEKVHPQYNLVSFSTVPYTEARRRGEELERIVEAVAAGVPRFEGERMPEQDWNAAVRAAGAAAMSRSGSQTEREVIDISPVLSPRTGVWPGDTPVSREVLCEIARGATVTLSTLRTTVHAGAHADGPNHYAAEGRAIDAQPLGHYVGACVVVDAEVKRGERVKPEDCTVRGVGLRSLTTLHPRVLVKTGTFPDPERWNADFSGLSVELIEFLASRGVVTIGVDTPSVDLQESKDLPAHKAVYAAGMAILEGLVLARVPSGEYELLAAPLRLEGFDASPVRALLRRV